MLVFFLPVIYVVSWEFLEGSGGSSRREGDTLNFCPSSSNLRRSLLRKFWKSYIPRAQRDFAGSRIIMSILKRAGSGDPILVLIIFN